MKLFLNQRFARHCHQYFWSVVNEMNYQSRNNLTDDVSSTRILNIFDVGDEKSEERKENNDWKRGQQMGNWGKIEREREEWEIRTENDGSIRCVGLVNFLSSLSLSSKFSSPHSFLSTSHCQVDNCKVKSCQWQPGTIGSWNDLKLTLIIIKLIFELQRPN